MNERKDVPEEFIRAFQVEDALEERRGLAELIYNVGHFIVQKDFYRGREVNRKSIEQGYSKSMRRRSNNFPGLDNAVAIIVHRFVYDNLLSPVKPRGPWQPLRRSTKFTFKVDDDSLASYYDDLVYFGEQASIDSEQVDRHRLTANSIKKNIETTNKENFQY